LLARIRSKGKETTLTRIQPWLVKGSRHKFRAEIFKLLDSVELGNELAEARVFQAAIDEKKKSGEVPYFDSVQQDVTRRLRLGEITAEQAQEILDHTRETIALTNRGAEERRLLLYELEAKAHEAFMREACLLEEPLKQRWDELYAQDRKLKAALRPLNVYDDSSAIRAGEKAAKHWMRRLKVYPRLVTIWSIATKLREVSIIYSVTTLNFWPAEYQYRYPDRLLGVNQIHYARNLAERISTFDQNIDHGCEPGFYTAADVEGFIAEEQQAEAAKAKPRDSRALFAR
jgi:hypothetical protein